MEAHEVSEEMQDVLDAEARVLQAYEAVAKAVEKLPRIPETGCTCDAGLDRLHITESGYGRVTKLTNEEQDGEVIWFGHPDGWDDMTEGADGPTMVICLDCDRLWRLPEADINFP